MNHRASAPSLLLWLAAALATPALAADPVADLAKASGCMSCHAAKEKLVGPAFQAIAQKYAGQKDAAAELAMSIQNGSVRKWGRIPMPAHGSLAAADVQKLALWVLQSEH